MKIDESDLDGFGAELVTKCMATRRDRVAGYNGLKHYLLFGAQEGDQAPYNKIYPHMDLLTSFLYSQATVAYEIAVKRQQKVVFEQAQIMSDDLNEKFHDDGVADLFQEALLWGLTFNSTLLKFNWNGRLYPYMVEPHNFGVLREDVANLDDQEAFVHTYTISEAELRRRVSVLRNGEDIMRRVHAMPVQAEDAFPDAINRLIVAGTVDMTSSTTQGMVNIPDLLGQLQYKPKTVEDLVEMYELWVWDDDNEDYRTITIASPGVVIYGRKEIGNLFGIKGEHPFIHVCPNRLYDYFFGWSEITMLLKLQDWISERLRDIRRLTKLQADPPKAFSGWGGITDEKINAFWTPGGAVSEPTPNAKVDVLAPKIENDLYEDIRMAQEMFNDESGLSDILQGHGETGVRAKGHADILARLGSARIKKRALSVERTLEEIGSLIVKMTKAKDATEHEVGNGMKFIAKQFTDKYRVHVDAHSASPVFVDDHINLAFGLAKAAAISPVDLIRLTKPPGAAYLEEQAKQRMEAQAKMAQEMAAKGIPPEGGSKKLRAA